MLHILWMLLKFILIFVGILLGLVLLVLLLVLFCPVRYRIQAVKADSDWKEVQGEIGISWLFHGISVLIYRKEKQKGISVRILGFPIEKLLNRKKKPEKGVSKPEVIEPQTQRSSETDESLEEVWEEAWGFLEQEPPSDAQETPKKKRLFLRISEKLSEMRTKIKGMKATFHNLHDKISWWKKFLDHPRTWEAVSFVWKYGKGLLLHILPTKVWGKVRFGFSDPSVTGRALGFLGMSFPLHKNCVAVTPCFEGENILEGEVYLRGRIYGFVLLKAAIAIYFNKNLKYVIKRAKHGNHKEG